MFPVCVSFLILFPTVEPVFFPTGFDFFSLHKLFTGSVLHGTVLGMTQPFISAQMLSSTEYRTGIRFNKFICS